MKETYLNLSTGPFQTLRVHLRILYFEHPPSHNKDIPAVNISRSTYLNTCASYRVRALSQEMNRIIGYNIQNLCQEHMVRVPVEKVTSVGSWIIHA